jgi:hypothetical protein
MFYGNSGYEILSNVTYKFPQNHEIISVFSIHKRIRFFCETSLFLKYVEESQAVREKVSYSTHLPNIKFLFNTLLLQVLIKNVIQYYVRNMYLFLVPYITTEIGGRINV